MLAREGADVALLARNTAGLEEVARRVEGEGAHAVVVPADVADREAVERAVECGTDRLGGLDIAVVAAAAGAFGRFTEIPPEDFDRCVRSASAVPSSPSGLSCRTSSARRGGWW
jgi:NAD(P)-dependent dehydrogenase (short-subunit alcohol dehydrogenase family)